LNDPSSNDSNVEFDEEEDLVPTSYTQQGVSFSKAAQNIQLQHSKGTCFSTKESTLNAIKQFHIDQGFKFVVVESKLDRYVVRCTSYGIDYRFRIQASFSKI